MSPRKLLLDSFNIAVAAADPLNIVPQHLPKPPKGRTFVVGAGKASAAMALAVERHWPKKEVLDGIVITSYGCRQVELLYMRPVIRYRMNKVSRQQRKFL